MTVQYSTDSELRQMQAGVDALSEGFALFGDTDELVFCNSAFRRLYPDLDSFLEPGISWPMFMVEATRKRGTAEFDQLDAHLRSGLDVPLTLEASSRGSRWHRMGVHPATGGGFVLTETDVTDQHQALEIIAHADDLLQGVLDACASRIVLCRLADGALLYKTPAWQQTFGGSQPIKSTFADPVNYADLLTEILATNRVDDREYDMLRADNQSFPARLSARMIDYQGEQAVVLSAEDLTQLHAQREEIIRTNQRLLDAIEALDQGFVLFDSDHRLLMANRRYMDINQPIDDALVPGTHNTDIVAQSLQVDHEPLAAGWPQSGNGQVTARYEFELKDKRAFSASRRATSDQGFVLAWQDVTEMRATEQELNNRREAAFQNEKLNALGQLLTGVAHELNNPLSVVLGHAMMLKEEVSDPDTLEGIEKISLSAERCAKIVKMFLEMARQKPAQIAQANLNDIIELALEIASYGLRKNGVDVELLLDANLPTVEIDEDQVTQVFINLMINSEQALASETDAPRLKIATSFDSADNTVLAVVSDNGPGVPEAQRSRIFEPFFTTKSVGEGTGVGLALSHRIINSHGGQLNSIEGEIGGATFTVSLPAAGGPVQPLEQHSEPRNNTELKALLVEDEADVADVIQKMLLKHGVSTIVAADAEQGLEQLETDSSFDLILSDLRMPGMGGLLMLTEIEARWPHLSERVVFITGDTISEDVLTIRRKATHQIIEKPVSPSELQALVHSIQYSVRTIDSEAKQ